MRRRGLEARRVTDILLSVLVLFGAVGLAWAGLNGTKSMPVTAEPYGEQVSIPEEAIAVVIDAGHGGFDGGAVGNKTGAVEAELNLAIAKYLADELTRAGMYVVMTRADGNAIGETKSADMQRRKEIMNLDNIDLVVSVHINKFRDSSVSGPMVFYMKGSEEGKRLAERIMYSLCEAVGRPQRLANPEDLFVLRVPEAPSVLVECGFLSNAEDEAKLITEEYQKTLAKGIAEGVSNYLALLKNGDND